MKFLIFLTLIAPHLVTANFDKTKFVKKEANFVTFKNLLIDSRLEGGENAGDLMYPYAAELNVRWRDGRLDTCTGALLSTTYVITARECIFDDAASQSAATVMILLGSASRANQRQGIFIQWAVWLDRTDGLLPHPNFGLTLLSQAVITSPTLQPVRMPTFSQSLSWFSNLSAQIAGWGETTQGTWSENLQHGRVIINVREVYEFIPGISEYELSARTAIENPSLRLQYGDQGGPMILNEGGTHTIIGVLWKNRQFTNGENVITAFRIGHFWDFIHDVTDIPRRW